MLGANENKQLIKAKTKIIHNKIEFNRYVLSMHNYFTHSFDDMFLH